MATKREALDKCNRLKPGFKFKKGGAIVKVTPKKAKKRKAAKKK